MAMSDNNCNDGMLREEFMDLPGFRFYPTEEELLTFYMKKKIHAGHQVNFDKIIPTLHLYQYDPWELPGLAHDPGARQWFFFVPRYHKECARTNRQTASGHWKATGTDRAVRNELFQCIGLKKILVFYKGKGRYGQKTDWIMNEYRIPDFTFSASENKRDFVLCRIYRKTATQKSSEQRAQSNDIDEEEPVVSSEMYGDKSQSMTFNDSCLSNPVIDAKISSLKYVDGKGECSSLDKTKDESSLFDFLEPIIFSEDQEPTALKTYKACKPPQLEMPTLSMDFLFGQQIATPRALLATPSPFQIPLSSDRVL